MNALSKRRLALYLTLLFLAGMVTGGSLSWSLLKKDEFKPGRGDLVQHFQKSLQSQLNLSSIQVDQIRPALEKAVQALSAIHEQAKPQMDQVFTNLNTEITPFLTPEQGAKLQEMDRKRREHPKGERRPH